MCSKFHSLSVRIFINYFTKSLICSWIIHSSAWFRLQGCGSCIKVNYLIKCKGQATSPLISCARLATWYESKYFWPILLHPLECYSNDLTADFSSYFTSLIFHSFKDDLLLVIAHYDYFVIVVIRWYDCALGGGSMWCLLTNVLQCRRQFPALLLSLLLNGALIIKLIV